MGRLIDADAIKWDKCEDADGNPVYVLDKRDIDKQPTAYEPDKVVEQLEEYREEMEQFKRGGMLPEMIEVVKEGGVDG